MLIFYVLYLDYFDKLFYNCTKVRIMFYREITPIILCELQKIFFKCSAIDSLALGGSRARGVFNLNSDYDLFCVVYQELFDNFRNSFIDFLMKDCHMIIAAEEFYLENWGYLFKAFDKNMQAFDISIIPDNRIKELGIKNSNILLFDKSGLYLQHLGSATDNDFLSKQQYMQLRKNTINKIVIDLFYVKSIINKKTECDYWEGIKYIERIRRNIMILIRMNENLLNRKYFSPEKNFAKEINDNDLRVLYSNKILDTNLFEKWKKLFISLCLRDERAYVYNIFSVLLSEGENEDIVDRYRI